MPDKIVTPYDYWSSATSFPQEATNFGSHPVYSCALAQLRAQRSRFNHIIEVGSGSGAYLSYLHHALDLPVIGSDIPNPRLEKAVRAYRDIPFVQSDAISTIRRYGMPNSAIISMHVFGNLPYSDVNDIFATITSTHSLLTFAAIGLPGNSETASARHSNYGFRHNYFQLIDDNHLRILEYCELPTKPDENGLRCVFTVRSEECSEL